MDIQSPLEMAVLTVDVLGAVCVANAGAADVMQVHVGGMAAP